ncbi:hypothetical protein BDZ94DRAFT_1304028 [Collybia nuda]|uniref:Uncharacterized protein n=1 Tax=Collybia nuda TaxID=64659 RepID=A0A9P6CJV0_9AGAR|nr:hypothetical protein BDZ94DRAFT_1304028 [Collybia nuda]
MDDMDIDESPNEIFVPVPNNPLHRHGPKDVMGQSIPFMNIMGGTLLPTLSSLDILLLSSSISDVDPTKPTSSNQAIVAPTLQQVSSTVGKSSLKVNGGYHTAVKKHVRWKTPEVESSLTFSQTKVLPRTLSSQPLPNLPDYSAKEYHFSNNGTQNTVPTHPVHRPKKSMIVAFTPRQHTPIHGTHITRINLAQLLKGSTQESVQAIERNLHIAPKTTSPTTEEQAAVPPRIGHKLGPPISRALCQTSQSITEHSSADYIRHQALGPPTVHHTPSSLKGLYSAPTKELPTSGYPNDCPHTALSHLVGSFSTTSNASFMPVQHCTTKALTAKKPSLSDAHLNQKNRGEGSSMEHCKFQHADVPHGSTITAFKDTIGQPTNLSVSNSSLETLLPLSWLGETPSAPHVTPTTPTSVAHNIHVPLLADSTPTLPYEVSLFDGVAVPNELGPGEWLIRQHIEANQENPYVNEHPDNKFPQVSAPLPISTTFKPKVPIRGLENSVQGQVNKGELSQLQNIVGKRKRNSEATMAVQPVLKTLRSQAPDKHPMSILFTHSSLSASPGVSPSDEHAQLWVPDTFISRNRRLSLNSFSTESPRDSRRIKFLTLPMVIEWKTQLDRIEYLYKQGKISQADSDKLEEVLLVVRANMDHPFLTAEWVKKAKMVMRLKEFRHKGKGVFTATSKRVAREIFDFWRESPKFGMACM